MDQTDQLIHTPAGSGGCFPSGTLIATPHGKKPIESIQVGDEVYCFDWNRNIHVRPVVEVSKHESLEVWRYFYWGGYIDATPNHGFLTEYGAFRPIHEFLEDHHLIDSKWQFRSLLKRECLDRQTTYNFRVQDFHSYLVGEHELCCMNGGGGKAGSGPTESDDDGRSTARGVVVELISEGEIEGLTNGKKSIYLDKTRVQNLNGSLNFNDFKFAFRRGTANQLELPGFADEVSEETNVGVDIKKDQGPVSRSIVNSELDIIRIRIAVQLQKYEENGSINGSEMRFRILIKQGTEAFQERLDRTIKGKFSSLTEFEYEFKVQNLQGTRDAYQVRIIRESDDSDSQRHQRVLRWQSYTEIIANKLSYPYSALIAMQFKAEEFDSIPSRAYQINGRIINIPNNAIVAADGGLNYSGVWNGGFYNPGKACSDPAWQLYDLMTNKRYGLGRKLTPDRIDKYSLYACSQRNNELIQDGLGGVERRYRCNTVLQSREKAWDVIGTFCSAFHAKPYWRNGKICFWQDRPGDVVQQFTQADVVDGDFIYSSTAVRTRFTVACITWFNPKNFFEREVEVVEDPEGIERYGIQKSEVVAFGCTSRAQAYRFGKWVLFSSLYELEMVSFTARSYAVYCQPGEIVQIADPRRSAVRYSGLISGATTNVIALDEPVELRGGSPQISCLMPNGTVQTRSVTNSSGIHTLISVSPAFSGTPQREANWIISTTLVKPQTFRILSVDLTPDPTQIEIRALQHYRDKYSAIEQDVPPLEIPFTTALFPLTS
jgi:predicted phage tail protein